MGTLSGKIASNGLTPTYVNSATNASPGKLYQCDTSSAAFTVTLPTGSSGSVLRFVDDKGTWATNNLTIAPAATQTIQGISGNGSLVCDLSGAYVEMTWDATSSQWCVQTTGFQYGPPASATKPGTVSYENGITYQNGTGNTLTWGGATPATYIVRFYRTGKNVTVDMSFPSVTPSNGSLLSFTLPADFKPSTSKYGVIYASGTATFNGFVACDADADGHFYIGNGVSFTTFDGVKTVNTGGVPVSYNYSLQ